MYEKIINEIKSNLGENKELNRNYLISQIDKYKNHPYSQEIIREISRMMWDYLDDVEKQEFIEINEKENPVRDILNEVIEYIQLEEFENALNMMNSFMVKFQRMFKDDKVSEYHFFENPLEEILFKKYIGTEKELRYIPDNQPYVDLYYIYGFLLFENNQLKEAEENLKTALEINPVDVNVILELCEIYKQDAGDEFFNKSCDALKYAYTPQNLAKYYRNLGYYYIEQNQMDAAIALYNYSLNYEVSLVAYTELQYISSKNINTEISAEKCLAILKEKNIQIGPNPFILKTLKTLTQEYEKNNYPNQALYFYNLLYQLTEDEKIARKISELEIMLNNSNII